MCVRGLIGNDNVTNEKEYIFQKKAIWLRVFRPFKCRKKNYFDDNTNRKNCRKKANKRNVIEEYTDTDTHRDKV